MAAEPPSPDDAESGLVSLVSSPASASAEAAVTRKQWIYIFNRLDSADGCPDGRIRSESLIEWFSGLSKQRGDSNDTAASLATAVQSSQCDFLDRAAFLRMVSVRNHLDADKLASLRKYLQVAAYSEQYRCCPPPWFMLGITFAQVVFFLFHIHHFLTHKDHAGIVRVGWHGPYPFCSKLVFNPHRRHEVWRYLTYGLVHAGVEHILINVCLQLLVGLLLEMTNGWYRIGPIYMAGILAGSLGTSCLEPSIFVAGASGGVFALMGAHLASIVLNWKEDKYVMRTRLRKMSTERRPQQQGTRAFRVVRLVFVLFFIGMDLGRFFYEWDKEEERGARTSYAAHVCGGAAGFLVGFLLLANRRVEPWERRAKIVFSLLLCVALTAAVVWSAAGNDFFMRSHGRNYFLGEIHETGDGHEGHCHY